MKLTMFREQTITDEYGQVIGRGQDALPYADGCLIMVADGMGGRGSTPHEKLPFSMFDEDTITRTLFDRLDAESYKTFFSRENLLEIDPYVQKSFAGLIDLKLRYGLSKNAVKESGYFGSRLAAAAMLAAVGTMDVETLMSEFAVPSKAEYRRLCNQYSDYFSRFFRVVLTKLAKRLGAELPAGLTGLSLFPTTLSAAICRETDDTVDVFYVYTGDSRCYVWTQQDGMMQVFRDRANADGSMSDYISAEDTCRVFCAFRQFKKPCMLFNATDGCYTSRFLLSPLSIENLLLECLCESESMEAASTLLKEQYDQFNTIDSNDDSASLALTAFGFSSFKELQAAASGRLEIINRDYLSQVPYLLQKKYRPEDDDANSNKQRADALAATLKGLIDSHPAVLAFCEKRVRNRAYMPDAKKEATFEAARNEYNVQLQKARNKLRQALEYVWPELLDEQRLMSLTDYRFVEQFEKAKEKYVEWETDYRKDSRKWYDEFVKTATETEACLKALLDADFQILMGKDSPVTGYSLDSYDHTMNYVRRFLVEMQRKNGELAQWQRVVDKYAEVCKKGAERFPGAVEYVAKALESGELYLDKAPIADAHKQRIAEKIERIFSCHHEYYSRTLTDRASCEAVWARDYWEQSFEEILMSMVNNYNSLFSPEDKAFIIQTLEEINTLRKSNQNFAQKQQQLFARYEYGYKRLLEEETAS